MCYLCTRNQKKQGSLAQLNRASDYGSEGYRFESYASHPKENGDRSPFFMQHRSLPNKLMLIFTT